MGPGSRLKAILELLGVQQADCRCAERAQLMDQWGATKCLLNIEQIIAWFVEEARRRSLLGSNLPMFRNVIRLFVRAVLEHAAAIETSEATTSTQAANAQPKEAEIVHDVTVATATSINLPDATSSPISQTAEVHHTHVSPNHTHKVQSSRKPRSTGSGISKPNMPDDDSDSGQLAEPIEP